MYYMEAKYAVSSMTCTQNIKPEIFKSIPQEANIPIPVKPDMIMMAHGHNEGKNIYSFANTTMGKNDMAEYIEYL